MNSVEVTQPADLRTEERNPGCEFKEELLFGGGAGALCYMVGYVQFMVELIGKKRLQEFKLGGISAGAAVAGLLHTVIHSEIEVSTIYLTKARRFYENNNHYYLGFITNGQLIYDLSREWYQENQRANLPSFTNNVHVYTSHISHFTIKPLLIDQFDDHLDFANAIKASCYLPLICGLALYTNYKGKKCLDGGITMPVPYLNSNAYKIYINVLPDNFVFTGHLYIYLYIYSFIHLRYIYIYIKKLKYLIIYYIFKL